jgi:signal transduction histidine kinase/ActR/RegA family two-component response regulator
MPKSDEELRVLVFAPVGRDAPVLRDVLTQAGFFAITCSDLDELIARCSEGVGAVLLAEESLFGKDVTVLANWISRQPPWSDLPFLVMTSKQEQRGITLWRGDVLAKLQNVVLLERPLQTISVVAAISAAVRARRRQYEIRSLLEARERAAAELESIVTLRTSELTAANDALRIEIKERQRAEEALRQTQKIEALGQLTGGIAHDFNNLLMVILGGLEAFERSSDHKRRARLLEAMKQAAQRGASLTKQLLAFSRKQELKPQTIDLAARIEGMKVLLDRSLRGDVTVSVTAGPDVWPVNVDPTQLELAILNLAVNARDAMPKGGLIEIKLENIAATASHSSDCVMISISDTGSGMSEDTKARAFEPFFTTKDVGHGSGLGLAQVHGFAKQSGGTVHIDSEVGMGTTISILLPRSDKTAKMDLDSSARALPSQNGVSTGSSTILLVEDDNAVAELVGEMLYQLGYQVLRAPTPNVALEAWSTEQPIDMVVSDVMMPGGMDGIELAKRLRSLRKHLPIVLISGYAESARQRSPLEEIEVLSKPFRLSELDSALRSACSKAMAEVEPRLI